MTTVAIIQARMGSSRLPGKVLRECGGAPLLFHIVERVKRVKPLSRIVIATTQSPEDDAIEAICRDCDWPCFRGSEADVLDRYYQAAKLAHARHILRVTADCPFFCPTEAEKVVLHHLRWQADYTHNVTVWGSGMPLGAGTEVFTFQSLEDSWRKGHETHHREHVDEYIYEHPELFHIERVCAPPELQRPEIRLTVDTIEDLALTREIYRRLYTAGEIIELREVIRLLDSEPALLQMNAHVRQKRI